MKRPAILLTLVSCIASSALLQPAATAHAQVSAAEEVALALDGYCPVCLLKMKKWVRGDKEFATQYDGKEYRFPSAKERDMFLTDPVAFIPALGGDCTVCYAKAGKRMPGSIQYAASFDSRVFLFPSDKERQMFLKSPKEFANIDLASNGNCVVCLAMMKKEVPGKPEFAAMHDGFRYLFPSAKERDMFISEPDKFLADATSADSLVTIQGTSACAGCAHGVHPINSPDELGLAVSTNDGTIFVVEDAHRNYPQIYQARFDGLKLEVSGKVLKREGKVAWIQPQSLKQVRGSERPWPGWPG